LIGNQIKKEDKIDSSLKEIRMKKKIECSIYVNLKRRRKSTYRLRETRKMLLSS
jgi:hypothetical protein